MHKSPSSPGSPTPAPEAQRVLAPSALAALTLLWDELPPRVQHEPQQLDVLALALAANKHRELVRVLRRGAGRGRQAGGRVWWYEGVRGASECACVCAQEETAVACSRRDRPRVADSCGVAPPAAPPLRAPHTTCTTHPPSAPHLCQECPQVGPAAAHADLEGAAHAADLPVHHPYVVCGSSRGGGGGGRGGGAVQHREQGGSGNMSRGQTRYGQEHSGQAARQR